MNLKKLDYKVYNLVDKEITEKIVYKVEKNLKLNFHK